MFFLLLYSLLMLSLFIYLLSFIKNNKLFINLLFID